MAGGSVGGGLVGGGLVGGGFVGGGFVGGGFVGGGLVGGGLVGGGLVGGTGVLVGGIGVLVGGMGVWVGGIRVLVGGMGVFVAVGAGGLESERCVLVMVMDGYQCVRVGLGVRVNVLDAVTLAVGEGVKLKANVTEEVGLIVAVAEGVDVMNNAAKAWMVSARSVLAVCVAVAPVIGIKSGSCRF